MVLYNQGSGIPVQPMNRMCPRPQRGQDWRQGGRGVFNTTRNSSLEYDDIQKPLHGRIIPDATFSLFSLQQHLPGLLNSLKNRIIFFSIFVKISNFLLIYSIYR